MSDESSFPTASDFKLIKDLTREEMIDEICKSQREQFGLMKTDQLRSVVIDSRMGIFRKRMIAEAGFDEDE